MARGSLRVYLGAAPGVGKTFAMLNEGWRRRERGTDVVVGYVETHGRQNTLAQLRDLEVVPRMQVEYRGATFEEMDLDAILARRPQVALVDELAHTNAPGCRHAKRYEDVQALLDAGIDVISTVNIQHLESVNDVVERITGIKQRETIPDAVVRQADQVELVDMTPEALRRRMAHGNIYAAEKVDAALGNYFRIGNLSALREIALLWVAERVDEALEEYREAQGISKPWETRERVVVAITGAPTGEPLIRRAARMAQRAHGELLGVHVSPTDGLAGPSQELIERHRHLLEDLGGEFHEVVGNDVASALTRFARGENATQLVLGSTRRSRWRELVDGSVINAVVREAGPIDVHVISQDVEAPDVPSPPARRRPRPTLVPPRRRALAWAIVVVGLPLLTVAMVRWRESLNLSAEMLVYLLLVTAAAAVGGRLPAFGGAIAALLLVNYFFTPPLDAFGVGDVSYAVALLAFVAVAALVGELVSTAAARSAEARQARAEAEALARAGGALLGDSDPVSSLLRHLQATFQVESATLLVPDGRGGHEVAADSGPGPPASSPLDGEHFELGDGAVLVLTGERPSTVDRRVLRAFVAQLDVALDRQRLAGEAAGASALAEADALRTAILEALSHDLRTPLAGIKAAASSLRRSDVTWSEEDRRVFLETIDEEADRLNRLVGNLVDLSRIEAGAVRPILRDVGVEEVVPTALRSISGEVPDVQVNVPADLPAVMADPALLERAVANVVANAVRHNPAGTAVRIEAGAVGGRVDLRVVDRGPGIRHDVRDQRDGMFAPFRRLGDGGSDGGLGLAVARGFVEAMGGELALDDTPGGGLTVVISLLPADPRHPVGAGPT